MLYLVLFKVKLLTIHLNEIQKIISAWLQKEKMQGMLMMRQLIECIDGCCDFCVLLSPSKQPQNQKPKPKNKLTNKQNL